MFILNLTYIYNSVRSGLVRGGTAWAAGPLPLDATTTLMNKREDLSHYFLYKTEKAIV